MNAQIKALKEERDHLNRLIFNVINQDLPFTVTVGELDVPESVTTKARWGMSSYITMRLREIDAAISKLQKESNA